MSTAKRTDHDLLQQWIHADSRVLDLGCGDGTLLKQLMQSKQIQGYGIENNRELIIAGLNNGTFDANTYIMLTRVLDYFDLAREYNDDPVAAFRNALCKFMVISFTTDWRFSPERSREIKNALITAGQDVSYAEIDTPQGHDAFLLPIDPYLRVFASYMQRVAQEITS